MTYRTWFHSLIRPRFCGQDALAQSDLQVANDLVTLYRALGGWKEVLQDHERADKVRAVY